MLCKAGEGTCGDECRLKACGLQCSSEPPDRTASGGSENIETIIKKYRAFRATILSSSVALIVFLAAIQRQGKLYRQICKEFLPAHYKWHHAQKFDSGSSK
jgi:hypothetical protein